MISYVIGTSTKVNLLAFFIEAPSTKVSSYFRTIGLSYFSESYMDGEPRGSKPITLVCGLISLRKQPMPETRPPPPQHTKT